MEHFEHPKAYSVNFDDMGHGIWLSKGTLPLAKEINKELRKDKREDRLDQRIDRKNEINEERKRTRRKGRVWEGKRKEEQQQEQTHDKGLRERQTGR